MGDFTFWISLSLSLSLSPKFGLSERLIQKVKSPNVYYVIWQWLQCAERCHPALQRCLI